MKKVAMGAVAVILLLVYFSRNALLQRGLRNGEGELTSLAFALGADVNARWSDGSTPLIAAAEAGNIEVVKKLLSKNAKVDWRHGETGATALMVASAEGHAEVVDALLAAGASLTERDKENRTAYWHAFRNRQFAIARKVHWVPRREMKTSYAGGGSGGGDYGSSGGGYDSGEIASAEPGVPGSESATPARNPLANPASAMANVPKFEPWKPPPVDRELSAEEADKALQDAGHVVNWKQRGNVAETQLTDEQQKVIDEAKRKKREEQKWAPQKDN